MNTIMTEELNNNHYVCYMNYNDEVIVMAAGDDEHKTKMIASERRLELINRG